MADKHAVVAIDGPAGSGKSTIAKKLAAKLGFLYVDTGAMYRTVTWKAMHDGISLQDPAALAEIARKINIVLANNPDGTTKVTADGTDVSLAIRDENVTRNIKFIADVKDVRRHLVRQQQEMRKHSDIVMEGRDITTVVFPDAEVKIFLDADVNERAQRRHRELAARGIKADFEKIIADMKDRDIADKTRPEGALRKTDDSFFLDTTGMSIDSVVENLYNFVLSRLGEK